MDFFFWLISLFQKPKLTHPEEPANPQATMANTDILAVRAKWFADWRVPEPWRSFWRHVNIYLDDTVPAAATWSEIFQSAYNPQWANPGVLAHEMAHISYYLLNPEEKTDFEVAYRRAATEDVLVEYLFSRKPYGKTNAVEGHADIYRFLGADMPADLIKYYPRLL